MFLVWCYDEFDVLTDLSWLSLYNIRIRVMVFNATFNNSSVISRQRYNIYIYYSSCKKLSLYLTWYYRSIILQTINSVVVLCTCIVVLLESFNVDAVVCQNNGQFQVWELNIWQFIVIVEIKYFSLEYKWILFAILIWCQ